ncbi:MAG: glycoside hydrolase domain-containing protein [Armatimonadota bacterium]
MARGRLVGFVVAGVWLSALIAGSVEAAEVEIVLQEGLDGYAGTADVMLYAPSSVAEVNYGRYPVLSCGINRWGEHQVSLLRFDLSEIPPGAGVRSARLVLQALGGVYPFRELTVDVRELTQANAGWVEGEGDGTRVPTPGAACWSYLSHPGRRWAGKPGASEAGVDYSTAWGAQVRVPAEGGMEVAAELPATVVRRWIERPETNAGLRLWPEMATEGGDAVAFAASEADEAAMQPRLVLTLEGDETILGAVETARARLLLEAAGRELAAARAQISEGGLPAAVKRRLDQLQADLARARAQPAGRADALARARALLQGQRASLSSLARRLSVERGREFVAAGSGTAQFALAVQRPTVKVFREARLLDCAFADQATVRLAGNEHEAVQVVVVPLAEQLRSVTWQVRGFDDPGLRVSVAPVGYVRENRPAYADVRVDTRWWPDPILDFLGHIDVVPRGEVRPLWVDVHATAQARPGRHEGELVVRAGDAQRRLRLRVEVFDFVLPVEQHLKTIWGMSEENFGRFYGERYDEAFAWRYFDMFLDHRISAANLYRSHPTGDPKDDAIYHLASVEALRRLRERGSGWWNVGYVMSPQWALTREPWSGMDWEQYLHSYVQMLRPEVDRVRAAGWPADRVGLYFLDETSDFEALGRAAEVMKAAYPEIPLMTTGYDRSYGLEDTPVSRHLDIWVPLTPRYHEDREKIAQGRGRGKQAWWYICVGPRDARALNWFVEFPAIRARLLMGAAARRYAVDGFLYYRVAGWASNDEPITEGPITHWNPVYRETLPDGDGQIICAGPQGPLTTVRFENIRDGIEDYEYWWLLDELIASGRAPAGALAQARAAQAVPDELLMSVHEYSEDPQVLEAVRLRVARAIEGIR